MTFIPWYRSSITRMCVNIWNTLWTEWISKAKHSATFLNSSCYLDKLHISWVEFFGCLQYFQKQSALYIFWRKETLKWFEQQSKIMIVEIFIFILMIIWHIDVVIAILHTHSQPIPVHETKQKENEPWKNCWARCSTSSALAIEKIDFEWLQIILLPVQFFSCCTSKCVNILITD